MTFAPLVLSIFVAFTSVWEEPQYQHIDALDPFIETLTEEQQEVFTDEFTYKLLVNCKESDVDPWLSISVMIHESAINPNAVAYDDKHFGLMQLSEKYHYKKIKALGGDDIFDAEDNMVVGVNYLGELKETVKNYGCLKTSELSYPLERLVVMSYNKGLGDALPLFEEGMTTPYADVVIDTYQKLTTKYGTLTIEDILSGYPEVKDARETYKEKVQ